MFKRSAVMACGNAVIRYALGTMGSNPPSDIYEVLERIRLRPGMYFGQPATLPLLQALLTGMGMHRGDWTLDLFDLRWWLAVRVGESQNNMIMHWLTEQHGPEGAFEIFFEHLDEFRTNSAELTHENTGPLKPRFHHLDGGEPMLPERLLVGRFMPSGVYFWGLQRQGVLEKQLPFCKSAATAKRLAAESWELARGWRKLKLAEHVDNRRASGFWRYLKLIRLRPGMYVGDVDAPLSAVESLLWGYNAALEGHDIADRGRGFSRAFSAYLNVRLGWPTTLGWAAAIRAHLEEGEDELSKFFAIVDELEGVVDEIAVDLGTLESRLDSLPLGSRRRGHTREWVVKRLRAADAADSD